MTDLFDNRPETYPAEGAKTITPSDTADYTTDSGAQVPRALYVGTQGNLRVLTLRDETVTFVGISGILPMRVKRVFSTSTTASDIIGMY